MAGDSADGGIPGGGHEAPQGDSGGRLGTAGFPGPQPGFPLQPPNTGFPGQPPNAGFPLQPPNAGFPLQPSNAGFPGQPPTSPPDRDPVLDRRARRRRYRQTATFFVFFLVIVGLGLTAYAAYQGKIDLPISSGRPSPLPTCPPTPEPSVQGFGDTNVNVYNASDKSGFALQVARELQKRGFKVPSQPANDPLKTKVTGAAVLRHGPKGLVAARTVATVVDGPVTMVADDRAGEDVDLVLGAAFKLKASAAKPSTAASVAPSAAVTCQPAPASTE